jgi:two-component system, chemotaxis family, response regulator PixG
MSLTNLLKEISNLNKHEDGEMTLCSQEAAWSLHFINGELLYATDKRHPQRRWDRALKQQGSTWNWKLETTQLANHQAWECQLLDKGVHQENLSLIRAKLIIRTVVQECFFELSRCSSFDRQWRSTSKNLGLSQRSLALSSWELQTVFSRATRTYEQWQAAGLTHLDPNLSPVLRQSVTPQSLPIAESYLNGEFTVWDIAWRLEQTITEVMGQLAPLVDKNLLRFQEIADSPLPDSKPVVLAKSTSAQPTSARSTSAQPTSAQPTSAKTAPPSNTAPSASKSPLIACIDDSPVLAHTLNKILVPAGYRTLSILEPMRGFTQLIEHKPDLILLDLQLPNADGYSICKFLRDTPVFQKTPIIILTAQSTRIDRSRATLAGATEFLTKPPQPEELLQVIRKYLS